MFTPEARAARLLVQHDPRIAVVRSASSASVPFATRLRWAGECLTAAYDHQVAGRSFEAGIIYAYADQQIGALRADTAPAQ